MQDGPAEGLDPCAGRRAPNGCEAGKAPAPGGKIAHPFAADDMPQPDLGEGAPLPEVYGLDRLTAMPRGPSSLYVYWELGGAVSARAGRQRGAESLWTMRVRDIESGRMTETRVDPGARNHYFTLEPGRRYVVELGVGGGDAFQPVCRSAECRLPPGRPQAGPAALTDVPERDVPARRPAPTVVPGLAYDPAHHEGSSWSAGVQKETTPEPPRQPEHRRHA